MDERDDAEPERDERLLVLHPDPRIARGTRAIPTNVAAPARTSLIAVIVSACVVLVLMIAVIFAFAAGERMNDRRDMMERATGRSDLPLPPATVPPPDRGMANATLRGNPGTAFSADSYPAEAIRAGEQGRVVARLRIDRTGTPADCVVQTSSGSASLDRATCRIALARVRYRPARDARGVAIGSSTMLPVRWVLPDDPG